LYLELVFLICAIATLATWAKPDPPLPIADHTYGEILDMAVIPVTGQDSEQSPSQGPVLEQ
jgi:hypothetical protein